MIRFECLLEKFGDQGEKTGWTYISIPHKIAEKLKPDHKKSFRVKGKIDTHILKGVALIPMGEGDFIMAVNATMRKAIKKIHGAKVRMDLEEDITPVKLSAELITCFKDEPAAYQYFNSLPPSHRNWYSNWVKTAKTENTMTKRIAAVIKSCSQNLTFSEMMKQYKEERNIIQ